LELAAAAGLERQCPLHAMNYQLASPAIPLAGLILAAPPDRAVGAVAHCQLAEQAAAIPDGETLPSLYDASIARFLAGKPAEPDPLLPDPDSSSAIAEWLIAHS
jgi:hypothetical protein